MNLGIPKRDRSTKLMQIQRKLGIPNKKTKLGANKGNTTEHRHIHNWVNPGQVTNINPLMRERAGLIKTSWVKTRWEKIPMKKKSTLEGRRRVCETATTHMQTSTQGAAQHTHSSPTHTHTTIQTHANDQEHAEGETRRQAPNVKGKRANAQSIPGAMHSRERSHKAKYSQVMQPKAARTHARNTHAT